MKNLTSLHPYNTIKTMPAQRAGKIVAVLFFLIFLTFAIGFTFQYFTEPTAPPQKLGITNVTENSLTISWISEKPTKGYVFLNPKPWLIALPFLNRFFVPVFADDHSQIATVHHVTLKNLKPETTYSYFISTGWRAFYHDHRGALLPKVKTPQPQENPPFPNPVYGKILKKDGITAAFPTIIYLTPLFGQANQRGATLSTITNIEGGWALDLPPLADKIEIIVEAGKDGSILGVFDANKAAPLPTLVL